MKKRDYNTATTMIQLPKTMEPNKTVYESLGFVFTEIEDDEVLYSVQLPEGWSLKSSGCSETQILDENGCIRGISNYHSKFCDRRGNMYLTPRYSICQEFIEGEDDKLYLEVYFGNKSEKIFVAGQCLAIYCNDLSLEESEKEEDRWLSERWNLLVNTMEYANENYPDWEDPCAYWNSKESKKLERTNNL